MRTRYLLDTNIISNIIRNPRGRCAIRLAQIDPKDAFTSIIVAAESRFGAVKIRSDPLSKRIEALLDTLHVMPFESPCDRVYAELRADLERKGQLIGGNDLLIAAQCLSLGCTLVTDNEREFSRVPALRLANWLR